jgi:hypothetical protein
VDDLLGSFRWYNALCINQHNPKERSQQVRSMGSIYASAQNTIIYLGESDENSDWTIQTLRTAGSATLSSNVKLGNVALRECINWAISTRGHYSRSAKR